MKTDFDSGLLPLCDILIVDDNAPIRAALALYLESCGYVVHEAKDGRVALEILDRIEVRMIITDLFMPEFDGLELILSVRKKFPGLEVLVISGDGLPDLDIFMEVARQLGVAHRIPKPFELAHVLEVVRGMIGEARPPVGV